MEDTCPICYCPLGDAVATTECGHKFCTRCLLSCMAKNTGTEEGSNRTKCPICRTALIQGEVEPSFKVTNRLYDLTNEVSSLKRDNLINMYKAKFYEFNWNELRSQFEILKENYRKSQFISLMRKNTLLKFNRISAIKIQKWSRMILGKRKFTLIKHRNAWKIYKSIKSLFPYYIEVS